MRVAVVGATGNVGTAVVRALAAEAAVDEIVAVARREPERLAPKMTFVEADMARDDLRPAIRGADAVVHLAWLFQPTHDPAATWYVNVGGTARVLAAAHDAGVGTFVYASSVGAYSPGSGPVDESWPTHSAPTSAYGREKAYVERMIDEYEATHPETRVVRFRPAFIFQPASATAQRRLFIGPFFPNPLAGRGILPAVPLPVGLRFQALHTDDAADAYRRAVLGDARGAYNLAADPVIDVDVLGSLLETTVLRVPDRMACWALSAAWRLHLTPADPKLFELVLSLPLLDSARARIDLGWSPQHSGVDALRQMVDALARGAGGPSPPLAPDSPARRVREVASGIGQRASASRD